MDEILLSKVTKDDLIKEIREAVIQELKPFLKEENLIEANADDLMCRKDVCRMFNIHESTLNRWKNLGKLISYNMGGKVFYKRSEILRKLNQKTTTC
ncbi:helix-turn-helix domain-containing protein [Epilithonimonas caeni]|uniref:helix-turn-helix domain-containing protein n=1 Tax=Epilithonimonas caeni TaxID=365343 RepID=UPI000408E342|nr:helix-turn-helix domain-containing protein [Epilithonimonas caeni]